MNNLDLFRGQFLLTKSNSFELPWKILKIAEYNLYYHPDNDYTYSRVNNVTVCLLGFLFDYKNPSYSNQQIVDDLANSENVEQLIKKSAEYSGHFSIIYQSAEEFVIFSDCAAQSEIYYDVNFTTIGSQPKLLGTVIELKPHTSSEASEFYNSGIFQKTKIFVGQSTHCQNILHLKPNHYIDINAKEIIRFFPNTQRIPLSIEEASNLVQKMLKGFVEAASVRQKLAVGVTGGYDSRVLFLASLNTPSIYYVTLVDDMDENHYEVTIPRKLTSIHGKDFRIQTETTEGFGSISERSLDFSSKPNRPGNGLNDCLIINGLMSEIGRNSKGWGGRRLNPADLVFLFGYKNDSFVMKEMKSWWDSSSDTITKNGYDIMDIIFWEERLGEWAAKTKTEMAALGIKVYSPFNCLRLIEILLSTDRKYRETHYNVLFNHIIDGLSPKANGIPVNPTFRNKVLSILQKHHMFKPLYIFALKTRLLKR